MGLLTPEQVKQHRGLVMRLQRDGCPPEYIHAKTKLLQEAWALGLAIHWRAIWVAESINNETWRNWKIDPSNQ